MWPQPPPGGFLVPPFYCPVSAEIICGPRRPLANQPAPQSLPDPVTISDVGSEEWLEALTPCANEGQITLDLSGPEQWPMSAEIICGPRRPLAKQPAPQSSLLSKSESRIEGGSVVSAESPKKSKKEGIAEELSKSCKSSQKMLWRKYTVDPQLTESSDEEEKPFLTKFPKRKVLTKTKKTSLSSTSKRRTSILESRSEGGVSTETAKHSKDKGRTDELPEDSETPKQLKEEPPNLTDSSEEEVDEEDVKPRPASSGNMRGGAGVSALDVCTFRELVLIAISDHTPALKLDKDTLGDGSCFSHATMQQCQRPGVKLYLQGRGIRIDNFLHLKRQVAKFAEDHKHSTKIANIRRNFELSQQNIHEEGLPRISWANYWKEQMKRETWADDIFLQITAYFLRVDLRIIYAGAKTSKEPFFTMSGNFTEDAEEIPTFFYGYIVGKHYQSLLPQTDAPVQLQSLSAPTIEATLKATLEALKQHSSQQGNEVSLKK